MMKFEYKYAKLDEHQTNQYKGITFTMGQPVDAIYVKSPNKSDKGNPFIEALPKPRLKEEVTKDYEISIPVSNNSTDEYIALTEISSLKSVRFKLPFHNQIETEMYNCLLNSYRSRKFIVGSDNNSKTIGNVFDAATDGFNLLGESGSGKSSSLKILLSRYPQVINHHFEGIGDFKQIVYLVVSTSPNTNFSALYLSIAKSIDDALGFVEPVHEAQFRKRISLGEKTILLEKLIEKYSIGMILIDEIQMMSFSTATENSYTSLAKLSNDTKVSIATIGLPDAMKKMFTQEWTARRLGTTIQADLYCENYQYFAMNLNKLLKYNWLKYPIEVTEDGVLALFEMTNGAIAHLISFYMRIQLNNLGKDKQVTLTREFIETTMNKYFHGLVNILTSNEDKSCNDILTNDIERSKIINEANIKFNEELNRKLQEAEIQNQLIEEQAKKSDIDDIVLLQYIQKVIKAMDPEYTDKDIIKALEKVIKSAKKGKQELSKEDALIQTLQLLHQPKQHPRKIKNNKPQQVNKLI